MRWPLVAGLLDFGVSAGRPSLRVRAAKRHVSAAPSSAHVSPPPADRRSGAARPRFGRRSRARRRGGQRGLCRHGERHRPLPGGAQGLFPRRGARRHAHAIGCHQQDGADARHRRSRRRLRHRRGRHLQRGQPRRRAARRGRQGLDAAGLRLRGPAGAQGPGRQRPLQGLRRPQGHEDRGRQHRRRQRVGRQPGAPARRPALLRCDLRHAAVSPAPDRLRQQGDRRRHDQRADHDARGREGRRREDRRQRRDLSAAADRDRVLLGEIRPHPARGGAQVHARLSARGARLHRHAGRAAGSPARTPTRSSRP